MSWIQSYLAEAGYIAIYLLILLETIFPPIPSEIILGFGGFLTTQSDMTVVGVVIVSTLSAVSGALLLYLLGRVLQPSRFEALIVRYEKRLHLKYSDVQRAEQWFVKYGPWTVLVCRVIPILRSLISIPAGMSKMPLLPFILLTTLGSAVWNTIVVVAGALLGENWERILDILDTYSVVMYTVLGLALAAGVFLFIRSRRASQ